MYTFKRKFRVNVTAKSALNFVIESLWTVESHKIQFTMIKKASSVSKVILLLAILYSATEISASAGSPYEQMLEVNPAVRAADRSMGVAYDRLRKNLNPEKQRELKFYQNRWIKDRDQSLERTPAWWQANVALGLIGQRNQQLDRLIEEYGISQREERGVLRASPVTENESVMPPDRGGQGTIKNVAPPTSPTKPKELSKVSPKTESPARERDALQLLQEVHSPLTPQLAELEWLEKRAVDINLALIGGLKKATASEQPVKDLEQMIVDLKKVSSVLASENCAFKKSLQAMRVDLLKTREQFEEKIKKSIGEKNSYVTMLGELGPREVRAEALSNRYEVLKNDADHLTGEVSEWIEIYRDTLNFKGESDARVNLVNQLREKEKSFSADSK
jgi:uncharacterized protein YecT (DUF1311 family)